MIELDRGPAIQHPVFDPPGHIVEIAPVREMFRDPKHPYSELLIDSVPTLKERKALKITEAGLAMKAEIEKSREQVQNLE